MTVESFLHHRQFAQDYCHRHLFQMDKTVAVVSQQRAVAST